MALLDISKRLPVERYLLWGLAAGVLWAAINTLSAFLFGFDLLGKPLTRYTMKLKEASRISGMEFVIAPAPNIVTRPATVGACQVAAH